MSKLIEAVTALKDVLQQEEALLREGQLLALADLRGLKDEAVAMFEAELSAKEGQSISKPERDSVEAALNLAQTNMLRLTTMRNGVRDLSQRLVRVQGTTTVGAYGEKGQELQFSGAYQRYAKRV